MSRNLAASTRKPQPPSEEIAAYIPERFIRRVDAHVLGNYAHVDNYPLILCIVGEPGTGKTWQLRHRLEALGIKIYSVDSSMLEDELAGRPAKYLKEVYVKASVACTGLGRSAVVIDDFDTTLGEWEQNTGTVNHQSLLAFLMHIAEDPSTVDNTSGLSRVPIFITANHAERIYRPLMRYGRTDVFEWEPDVDERAKIVASILKLPAGSHDMAGELSSRYISEPISFFSHLAATARINSILEARKGWSTGQAIASEKALATLKKRCDDLAGAIDWFALAERAIAERASGKGRGDRRA